MNGPDNQAQESSVFGNGISSLRSLPTSATSSEKFVDVDEVGSEQGFADPPVIQIEVSYPPSWNTTGICVCTA